MRRSRGTIVAGALVALLTVILLASVPGQALHYEDRANEYVQDVGGTPELPENPPRTGYVEPDQRLSEVYDSVRRSVASFEQIARDARGSLMGNAPVETIDVMRDDGQASARHGGIGPWDASSAWHRSPDTSRGWSWWFGNESTGAYPSTDDALLLSPVIDLDTLGTYADLIPYWREGARGAQADLFTLTLVHRFNFAATEHRNLDGGRVELFTNLTAESYERGEMLRPIVDTPLDATYEDFVRGLGGPGFSGTENWTVSTFDLTPWAGHEIRLGFRVGTVSFSSDTDRFQDPDRFDTDSSRGWMISRAHVQAPAVGSNVKVHDPLSPRVESSDADRWMPRVAPGETPTARFPVVNLGVENESVDLAYAVRTEHPEADEDGRALHTRTQTVELAPGEVHTFEDASWRATERPRDAEVVWLGLVAEAGTDVQARYAGTQMPQAWSPLEIHASSDVRARLEASPKLGSTGEERTLRLELANRGNKATSVAASVEVAHCEPARDDEEPVTDELLDEDDLEKVAFLPANGAATLTWKIQPPEPGRHRFEVEVTGVRQTLTRNASVYSETGPAPIFSPGSEDVQGCEGEGSPSDDWAFTRPDNSGGIPGSDDGWYWVSGDRSGNIAQGIEQRIDLVGTPPARKLEGCREVPSRGTQGGAGQCILDVTRKALERKDVDARARGPLEDARPGYEEMKLHVRYMGQNIPQDRAPPVVHLEMTARDPIKILNAIRMPVQGMPFEPREALEETVNVEVPLPLSNATGSQDVLAAEQQSSWRVLEVDLDERIETTTGVKKAWNYALQEVRVAPPPSLPVLDSHLLVDNLTVSGIRVDDPSRGPMTILGTSGNATTDVGTWSCRMSSNPAPLLSVTAAGTSFDSCMKSGQDSVDNFRDSWERVRPEPDDSTTTGWSRDGVSTVWSFDEPAAEATAADARLVTPEISLSGAEAPVLVLEHEYGTPTGKNCFKAVANQERMTFQIVSGFLVEVQYLQSDGTWSPFYILPPEDGYPTPEAEGPGGQPREMRDTPCDETDEDYAPRLLPGDVFYAPDGEVEYFNEDGTVIFSKEVDGSGPRRDVFRLDRPRGGLAPPVSLEDRQIRLAFHAVTPSGSEYWNITNLEVRDRPHLARDVRIANASFALPPAVSDEDAGANVPASVGPGSTVPVEVRVENAGLFDESKVEVRVTVEGGDDPGRKIIRLPQGANRTLRFFWTVPESAPDGTEYSFSVDTRLRDHVDLSTANNVRNVGEVRVDARHSVEVSTSVAPSPGAAGVVHAIDTTVQNTGNVPLEDLRVERTIWRLGASPLLIREDSWVATQPLDRGADPVSVHSSALGAVHESTPAGASPRTWTPSSPGTYRITTEVQGIPIDDPDAPVQRQSDHVVEVLSPAFQDGFEGDRRGGVPGTTWRTEGGLWHERSNVGFRSSTSRWIGDGEAYPHEANASLISPAIDLSSAKSATLTLATNYSTEPFYDGGIVEVSPDGGRTWKPLEPSNEQGLGYPSELSPATSTGLRDADGAAIGGFSGSMPAEDRRDGWTVHTFPLHQVDDLAERGTLADLTPPRPDNGSLQRLGDTYTRPSWQLGGGSNADRFVVENFTAEEPEPRAGGKMWYTGALGRDEGEVDTTLTLEFPAPPGNEGDGRKIDVSFLEWRPGVTPSTLGERSEEKCNYSGTGGTFTCEATSDQGDPTILEAETLERTYLDSGWIAVEFQVQTTAPAGAPLALEFTYEAPGEDGLAVDNRGWAIDGVAIDGTAYPEHLDSWSVDTEESTPGTGWRRASGSPDVPGRWSATNECENQGGGEVVWCLRPEDGAVSLPANMDTRLVTPTVDMRDLSGRQVWLDLRHEYRFQNRLPGDEEQPLLEGGVVEVQVYDEVDQSFGPWRTLFTDSPGPNGTLLRIDDPDASNTEMPNPLSQEVAESTLVNDTVRENVPYTHLTPRSTVPFEKIPAHVQNLNTAQDIPKVVSEWSQRYAYLFSGESDGVEHERFDLSWLAGKRFRLGLHAWTNPHPATFTANQEHWTVQELSVETRLLNADEIRVRSRFGSDGSVAGGHFAVDDVSVGAVTYDRNLELDVEEADVPERVPDETVLWVNGTVTNRGQAARSGFGVQVEGEGFGGQLLSNPAPAGGSPSTPDSSAVPLPARTQALAVGPASDPTSTSTFSIPVLVPDAAAGTEGNLTVRLVDLPDDAEGSPRPLVDEVAGNKMERLSLSVERRAGLEATVELDPDRIHVGEAATIRSTIENTGTLPLDPTVFVNVTAEDDTPMVRSSEDLHLEPGGHATLSTDVSPVAPGNVTVELEAVSPHGDALDVRELPVGRSASAVSTSWETDLGSWSSWDRQRIGEDEKCKQPARQHPPGYPDTSPPDWKRVNDTSAPSGEWHLRFGAHPDRNDPPPGFQDAGLVSPPVDLTEFESPSLTLVHRPHFPGEGGAILEARILEEGGREPRFQNADNPNCRTRDIDQPNREGWVLLSPPGGYPDESASFPGVPPVGSAGPGSGTPSNLHPLGAGHPMFGGVSDHWLQTVFDLTAQRLQGAGGSNVDLTDHVVQFRLRGTVRESPSLSEGWEVDNVVVGDGGLEVSPDRADRTLVDGAAKNLSLSLHNPGTRLDTYEVSIDSSTSSLPRAWIDLGETRVSVPAGETRTIGLTLKVPVSENNQVASYKLSLQANSVFDGGLLDVARYDINVVPSLHSNLVPRLDPGGDAVEAGTSALLTASVLNTGLAESTPAKAEFWVDPPGADDRRTIAEKGIPPIPRSRAGNPGSTEITAEWRAPDTRLGSYEFGVEIDPANRIVEFDETDNVDVATLEVLPLQRPDLVVENDDVRVLSLNGAPLDAAESGDLVQVLASVHNEGITHARRVQVSLSMGPNPVAQRVIDTLPAGTARTLPFTVFAPGDTAQLTLQVQTLDAELAEDNNEAHAALRIQGSRLQLAPADEEFSLRPGEPADERLEVSNTGSEATLVSLNPGSGDFTLTTERDEFLVQPGSSRVVDAVLNVSARVPAGSTELPVEIVQAERGRSTTAHLTANVSRVERISIEPIEGASVEPGPFTMPVTVQNEGNVERTVRVTVEGPQAWGAAAEQSEVLAPGEAVRLGVSMRPGNTTAPGDYPVSVTAKPADGPRVERTVDVHVEPTARARAETSPVRVGQVPVVYNLTLVNEGNVPGTVAFDLVEPPVGWSVDVRHSPEQLAPGERSDGQLVFEPTADDRPLVAAFLARLRIDPATSVEQPSLNRTIVGQLNAQSPDVLIDSIERTPRFGVEEGQQVTYRVTVGNDGLGPAAPVEVRLYQNEELVDARTVEQLSIGAQKVLNLTLRASGGYQGVVASADPHELLVDRNRTNNAVGVELTASDQLLSMRDVPSVGPGLSVLSLAGIALWIERRRRRR